MAFREAGNFVDFSLPDISRRTNVIEGNQPRLDDSQVDGAREADGFFKARLWCARLRLARAQCSCASGS